MIAIGGGADGVLMRLGVAVTAAVMVAVSAAGCSGSGGADSLPAICPQTGTAVLVTGALVSPANGATGVSPSVGRITFTVSSPELQGPGVLVTLTPSGGGGTVRQPDSVITGNGISSSVIPTLASGTTYAVTVSATPQISAACQGFVSAALGSFTTQ